MSGNVLIMTGNPVDGFELWGQEVDTQTVYLSGRVRPWSCTIDAVEYASDVFNDVDWWIIEVQIKNGTPSYRKS